MTVIKPDTALYAALKFAPAGVDLTVYTEAKGRARTNVVAVLRKEPDGWDWQILQRPATADPSLLPASWPDENPQVISSSDLAATLHRNPELWCNLED